MAQHLRRQGHGVGRKRGRRLMRRMELSAVAPGPDTSHRHPPQTIDLYLRRHRRIEQATQGWCADVTDLPMAHGFVYLVAIMDWQSRRVLAWRLSTTQDPSFCGAALEAAIEHFGQPEMFTTDHGSQFAATAWTDVLKTHDSQLAMDGKGRWMDTVFLERLWRACKDKCVYLTACDSMTDAKETIGDWMDSSHRARPHSRFGDRTPDEVYRGITHLPMAA